jgi:prepilin peptidase CpaA
MTAPLWIAIPVVVLAAFAVREDLRTRRIPNLLTGPALLLGLLAHLATGGPHGALVALAAAVLAGAVLLPGWLLKFMGAGDVKLMAAIGAWLGGPTVALYAALFSLIAGGVISLAVAARLGIVRRTVRDAALLLPRAMAGPAAGGAAPADSGVRVPKALGFLAGTLLALCWHP